MKRNEIKQLQAKLEDREKVIQAMKQQEAVYLAQTDSFKVSWKTSHKNRVMQKNGVSKTRLQLLCVICYSRCMTKFSCNLLLHV